MRINLAEILEHFPIRNENSHKGSYGKIINFAGSKYYTGAAFLSSISALKTGAGYVTLACPESIVPIISSYSPDITLFPLKSSNGCIDSSSTDIAIEKAEEYDVISLGSGLSMEEDSQRFVLNFLERITKPVIIDADGLNAIANNNFYKFPSQTIITPHPKELSRLLNISVAEIQSDRVNYAVKTAQKFSCIVVLKGMNTIVTDGNKVYINDSGNSALSKAGSGDVLTGIISGFAAQKCDLFTAASLGVYIHGFAADIAIEDTTEYGLLASELIAYIPKAIKKVI